VFTPLLIVVLSLLSLLAVALLYPMKAPESMAVRHEDEPENRADG
jgi:hypothetical protein